MTYFGGNVSSIRVTLNISSAGHKRLRDLGRLVGSLDIADTITQSLQLYEYVAKKTAEGQSVWVMDEEGRRELIAFFEQDCERAASGRRSRFTLGQA